MNARLVALVPVLGLLLAGCSGSEDPEPLPVPSATVTASPTPTSAVPPSAAGTTPQAAAAFVRFYYEQLGQALVTLDSSKIKPLYASSCTVCARSARNIDAEKASGRRYSGGGFTVRAAEAIALDANRTAVSTVYDATPLILETGPSAPSPLPARAGIAVDVELVRAGDSWLVSEIKAP